MSEGMTKSGELLARGRREQQEEVELVRARIAARPRGPGDGPRVGSFTGFKASMPVQHIAKVSVAEYSLFYPSSAHGFLCPIFGRRWRYLRAFRAAGRRSTWAWEGVALMKST